MTFGVWWEWLSCLTFVSRCNTDKLGNTAYTVNLVFMFMLTVIGMFSCVNSIFFVFLVDLRCVLRAQRFRWAAAGKCALIHRQHFRRDHEDFRLEATTKPRWHRWDRRRLTRHFLLTLWVNLYTASPFRLAFHLNMLPHWHAHSGRGHGSMLWIVVLCVFGCTLSGT